MNLSEIADRFLNPLRGPTHLTLADQVAIAKAPKLPTRDASSRFVPCPPQIDPGNGKGAGTRVDVQAYPVPVFGRSADHMYDTFDDGSHRVIARGGPNFAYVEPHLTAQVDPANASPDAGRGGRLMFRGFLPGVSADEAARPAQRLAESVRRGGYGYNAGLDSNSYAADVVEGLFGCRPGDARTWGYQTRILEQPPMPQPEF